MSARFMVAPGPEPILRAQVSERTAFGVSRRLTPKRLREAKEAALRAAAIAYELESDHGGPDPVLAGARLRIAAKEFARAAREAGELP